MIYYFIATHLSAKPGIDLPGTLPDLSQLDTPILPIGWHWCLSITTHNPDVRLKALTEMGILKHGNEFRPMIHVRACVKPAYNEHSCPVVVVSDQLVPIEEMTP